MAERASRAWSAFPRVTLYLRQRLMAGHGGDLFRCRSAFGQAPESGFAKSVGNAFGGKPRRTSCLADQTRQPPGGDRAAISVAYEVQTVGRRGTKGAGEGRVDVNVQFCAGLSLHEMDRPAPDIGPSHTDHITDTLARVQQQRKG